jgi:putative DNA primase/helicase
MTTPSDKPRTYNGDLKNLPAALEPLTALPYWVLWRWEKRNGKWTKPPFQPNGQHARSDDPSTWSTYDQVIAVVDQYDGIGFMLPDNATLDLDGCRNLSTGTSSPWAKDLIDKSKTYVEVSPSGKGFKVIGLAAGDNVQKKWPIGDGTSLEAYRRTHRYTTITGNQLSGTPQHLANIDAIIDEVYAEHEGRRA